MHGTQYRPDENPPRTNVQEHDHEQVAEPFGRQAAFAEEVALPQRRRVDRDEFVPGAEAAIRTGIVAVAAENLLDRVARDGRDSELLELAEDASVAPAGLARQLEDDPADRIRSWSATALGRNVLPPSTPLSNSQRQTENVHVEGWFRGGP